MSGTDTNNTPQEAEAVLDQVVEEEIVVRRKAGEKRLSFRRRRISLQNRDSSGKLASGYVKGSESSISDVALKDDASVTAETAKMGVKHPGEKDTESGEVIQPYLPKDVFEKPDPADLNFTGTQHNQQVASDGSAAKAEARKHSKAADIGAPRLVDSTDSRESLRETATIEAKQVSSPVHSFPILIHPFQSLQETDAPKTDSNDRDTKSRPDARKSLLGLTTPEVTVAEERPQTLFRLSCSIGAMTESAAETAHTKTPTMDSQIPSLQGIVDSTIHQNIPALLHRPVSLNRSKETESCQYGT